MTFEQAQRLIDCVGFVAIGVAIIAAVLLAHFWFSKGEIVKMSYFPCQKCGKYVGVIGTTIFACGCKPDGLPDAPSQPSPVATVTGVQVEVRDRFLVFRRAGGTLEIPAPDVKAAAAWADMVNDFINQPVAFSGAGSAGTAAKMWDAWPHKFAFPQHEAAHEVLTEELVRAIDSEIVEFAQTYSDSQLSSLRAELATQKERTKKVISGLQDSWNDTLQEAIKLRAENERLRKYASHLPNCDLRSPRFGSQCTCGLCEAALSAVPAPPSTDTTFTLEERLEVLRYLLMNARGMSWPINWTAPIVIKVCEKISPSMPIKIDESAVPAKEKS